MTGARYCALGVLNERRDRARRVPHDGLEPDEVRRIGARPTGLGVLGLLISDPRTLAPQPDRRAPQRFGFPANHPQMTSFLGVPITVRAEVYGNLYLTDKVGSPEFTTTTRRWSRRSRSRRGSRSRTRGSTSRSSEVAVLEDRDRLARDLHDTVIQHLFAVGLSLQSLASTQPGDEARDRLQRRRRADRRDDHPDSDDHLRARAHRAQRAASAPS